MCSKEQLQALLIVLTQILTFALELETGIIKPQISKHNRLVLVPLPEAEMENTPSPHEVKSKALKCRCNWH